MWVLQLHNMESCISTNVPPTHVSANEQAMLLITQLACIANVVAHLKAVMHFGWACTLLLLNIFTSKLVSSKVTHHNTKKGPLSCNMTWDICTHFQLHTPLQHKAHEVAA